MGFGFHFNIGGLFGGFGSHKHRRSDKYDLRVVSVEDSNKTMMSLFGSSGVKNLIVVTVSIVNMTNFSERLENSDFTLVGKMDKIKPHDCSRHTEHGIFINKSIDAKSTGLVTLAFELPAPYVPGQYRLNLKVGIEDIEAPLPRF